MLHLTHAHWWWLPEHVSLCFLSWFLLESLWFSEGVNFPHSRSHLIFPSAHSLPVAMVIGWKLIVRHLSQFKGRKNFLENTRNRAFLSSLLDSNNEIVSLQSHWKPLESGSLVTSSNLGRQLSRNPSHLTCKHQQWQPLLLELSVSGTDSCRHKTFRAARFLSSVYRQKSYICLFSFFFFLFVLFRDKVLLCIPDPGLSSLSLLGVGITGRQHPGRPLCAFVWAPPSYSQAWAAFSSDVTFWKLTYWLPSLLTGGESWGLVLGNGAVRWMGRELFKDLFLPWYLEESVRQNKSVSLKVAIIGQDM